MNQHPPKHVTQDTTGREQKQRQTFGETELIWYGRYCMCIVWLVVRTCLCSANYSRWVYGLFVWRMVCRRNEAGTNCMERSWDIANVSKRKTNTSHHHNSCGTGCIYIMGAMSEEAKTEPGDQSEEEKLSDADIKSEKFEYDEDSDSDDEGQRAAAALLCQTLGPWYFECRTLWHDIDSITPNSTTSSNTCPTPFHLSMKDFRERLSCENKRERTVVSGRKLR